MENKYSNDSVLIKNYNYQDNKFTFWFTLFLLFFSLLFVIVIFIQYLLYNQRKLETNEIPEFSLGLLFIVSIFLIGFRQFPYFERYSKMKISRKGLEIYGSPIAMSLYKNLKKPKIFFIPRKYIIKFDDIQSITPDFIFDETDKISYLIIKTKQNQTFTFLYIKKDVNIIKLIEKYLQDKSIIIKFDFIKNQNWEYIKNYIIVKFPYNFLVEHYLQNEQSTFKYCDYYILSRPRKWHLYSIFIGVSLIILLLFFLLTINIAIAAIILLIIVLFWSYLNSYYYFYSEEFIARLLLKECLKREKSTKEKIIPDTFFNYDKKFRNYLLSLRKEMKESFD